MNERELWARYQRFLCQAPSIGLELDLSRMKFDESFIERMADPIGRALEAMDGLEGGATANPDEDRMVGHYWLRAPDLAPDKTIGAQIEKTRAAIKEFADGVHSGTIKPESGDGFYVVLVIGIGGSALGPQFICDALGGSDDPMIVRFIDNTDPDGIARTLAELDDAIAQTLTIVVSKSGGTKETRNGLLEVADFYQRAGLEFAKHAVAVTCDGSLLHQQATKERWLSVFPIWDWVGGRTSITSAVGLLPAALQGLDIDSFLAGARDADVVTRSKEVLANPAALLALMWHYAGNGRGDRHMIVMPYRDRLALFGKYLQQLVMESIGKKHDRNGKVVHQGLTVLGNKGSTDQHSFVQQLIDGRNDFFVTFVTVRRDGCDESIQVEKSVTTGDFLHAFWLGTRDALYERDRESITITLDQLNARRLGALVATYERAVGLYAELIDVNAYNQPGVEGGKKAAGAALDLQLKAQTHLAANLELKLTAEQIATAIGEPEAVEDLYHILEYVATSPNHAVRATGGRTPFGTEYGCQ